MGIFRDTHFALQKSTNPQSKQFGVQESCIGFLDYSEFPNFLPRDVKGEYFAKGTENCIILRSLMGKEEEKLEYHGSPKVQDLVDKERWICWRPGTIQTKVHTSLWRA